MSPIRFGTDGWRAIIAEEFTFHAVARLSQAAARFWRKRPQPGTSRTVVVGYDTRFASDRFAQACAEVFAGNGFKVLLADRPVPTPSVSFAVRQHHAAGGVMITASHNPAIFNGFKLKAHYGGAADTELLRHVELELDRERARPMPLAEAMRCGRVVSTDLHREHFVALKQLVDFKRVARARLRFAHEALHGVGAGCFERLLAGTSCRVTPLHAAADVLFGGLHPEPIAANYREASAFLRRHPHDLCLVTDGDADRIGGLDGRGRPLTTHQLICLILHHLAAHRGETGRVVKAITTTSMVDRLCEAHGLPLTETGVGFKYICAEMASNDVLAGVEESGGVALGRHIPERDGLAAGLLLLELLATRRQSVPRLLKELEREFGPHRYGRVDLQVPRALVEERLARLQAGPPTRLIDSPVERLQTFDGCKMTARDGSWLMLRGSGTEPVLRIYAEARSKSRVEQLLARGKRLMGLALRA
jgi:phosphomannomutase